MKISNRVLFFSIFFLLFRTSAARGGQIQANEASTDTSDSAVNTVDVDSVLGKECKTSADCVGTTPKGKVRCRTR